MRVTFVILFLCPAMFLSQERIFVENTNQFGPCRTYLNILGYHYTYGDLKKDSLFFSGSKTRWTAFFSQNKNGILAAKIYDAQNSLISSGDLQDGNGQLAILNKYFFHFRNGKLNDTTVEMLSEGRRNIYVFKDNILIYEEKKSFTGRTTRKFDDNGLLHDSSIVYGSMPRQIPLPHAPYVDPYDGKLYQARIYEHGQLKEEIFFKKNGQVKTKEIYKVYRQPLLKKLPSNCF